MKRSALVLFGLMVLGCNGGDSANGDDPDENGNGNGSTEGVCAADQDPCDAAATQPDTFVCVEGTCWQACSAADLSCPLGQLCDTSERRCGPSECPGYGEDGCHEFSPRCVPVGNDAYQCMPQGVGAQGSICTTHADCGVDLLCVDEVCLPVDGPDNCTVTDGCADASETCVPYPGRRGALPMGVCLEACAPWEESCADASEWCVPGEYIGDIEGACVAAGTAGLDESCSGVGCAAGLFCVSDTMTCKVACDPAATTGSGGDTCEFGENCSMLSNGAGYCSPSCEAFADSCTAGKWCLPGAVRNPATDKISGTCISEGTQAEGDACGAGVGNCVAGAMCLGSAGAYTCRRVCDPESATSGSGDTCEAGDPCAQVTLTEQGAMPYGLCQAGCVAFTESCEGEAWCSPRDERNDDDQLLGTCTPPGTAALGAPCQDVGCVEGLICLSTDGGTTYLCETLCDTESATSGLGACATGTCNALDFGDGPLPYGYCG